MSTEVKRIQQVEIEATVGVRGSGDIHSRRCTATLIVALHV
jgi:hypothetical protein